MQIFDGHNDVLSQMMKAGDPSGFTTGRAGHIDLPRLKQGGMVGGFFAIWVPSPGNLAAFVEEMRKPAYDLPLPAPLDPVQAQDVALAQAAILQSLHEAGHLTICTSTDQIRTCVANDKIAAILHLEGADPIDPDFTMLHRLVDMGLRSLGPVWSRPTRFAHGVPFRYPAGPDTGPGLTPDGVSLIETCNALGVMIDLSHITEAGFWDVARTSTAPLVATHSNAHALCPHSRNLTDEQLTAIGDSGGVVGLNYATAMLRPDGQMLPETGPEILLAHLDHMMAKAGADSLALGSDFDGAVVPAFIGDAAGLPRLVEAMERHGYPADLIEKICHRTWLRVLDATWH